MSLAFLLDENVEHEVAHRLDRLGHDVEHADLDPALGKGASDGELAANSLEGRRIIVTYDDDFLDLSEEHYHCVLFFEDREMPAKTVARIVQNDSEAYPTEEFRGIQKLGREWL